MKGMLHVNNKVFSFGFTGTQEGMTDFQVETFIKIINKIKVLKKFNNYKVEEIEHHNGCCIGSDQDCYDIVKNLIPNVRVVMHPPKIKTKTFLYVEKEERPPLDYLKRNMQIVVESNILIATPKEVDEQLRSGTWSTIRYARQALMPVIIIFPNGSYRYEKPEKL